MVLASILNIFENCPRQPGVLSVHASESRHSSVELHPGKPVSTVEGHTGCRHVTSTVETGLPGWTSTLLDATECRTTEESHPAGRKAMRTYKAIRTGGKPDAEIEKCVESGHLRRPSKIPNKP